MRSRLVLVKEHGPFSGDQYFTRMNELLGEEPFLNGWHYVDRELYAGKNPEKPKGRKKSK